MVGGIFGEKSAAQADSGTTGIPYKKHQDYKIFSGPDGTMAVLKRNYVDKKIVIDPQGKQHPVDVTGVAFNQTALRVYIDALKRMENDTSHEEKILKKLEQATANAGQTEIMNAFRMSGAFIGDLENGKILLEHKTPVNVAAPSIIFT